MEVSSLDPLEVVNDFAGAEVLTPLDCFAERLLEKHVRSRPQSASVAATAGQSASWHEFDPQAKGDAESKFYARVMAHVSTLQGARLVRVSERLEGERLVQYAGELMNEQAQGHEMLAE